MQISVYFFVTRIMLLYFAKKWLVFIFTQRGWKIEISFWIEMISLQE